MRALCLYGSQISSLAKSSLWRGFLAKGIPAWQSCFSGRFANSEDFATPK